MRASLNFFADSRARYGSTLEQQALVDMYLDGVTDVRMKRDPLRYFPDVPDDLKDAVCASARVCVFVSL